MHEFRSGEVSPTLSSDALEIFYSALVSGSTTGFDVYHATRTATDQPFSPPALVPELQTAGDEVGNRLSQDGATLWLISNSYPAGGMNAIMYVTRRGCL